MNLVSLALIFAIATENIEKLAPSNGVACVAPPHPRPTTPSSLLHPLPSHSHALNTHFSREKSMASQFRKLKNTGKRNPWRKMKEVHSKEYNFEGKRIWFLDNREMGLRPFSFITALTDQPEISTCS